MKTDREMIKQILKGNLSSNQIALSRGRSHVTVGRYKDIIEAEGLTLTQIDGMSDSDLKPIFFPGKINTQYIYPDCQTEVSYLEKGYTKQEAHARYVEEVGEAKALKYSAYCERLQRFQNSQKTEFRHYHTPAEEMQIDYGGKRPTGRENGKERKFELFVAVFPASSYLFAVCTRTQSTTDTIEASIKALEFFGGVPQKIVSDNLKAVVIRNSRGVLIINKQYLAFADYYNTRIAPTRVASPTDKASVEVSVKLVQDKLRAKLRDRPPLELNELNKVIKSVVNDLNARQMKRGGETRSERFMRLDKQDICPLPLERITYLELPVERRVPASYHVSIDNVHYSVPPELVGRIVLVRKSSETIEVRHDGLPVAIHHRSYEKDSFVTIETHRPENHKTFIDIKFREWKEGLPESVREIIETEIKSKRPSKERLMKRVKLLEREYPDRLNTACERAIGNERPNLTHVTNLLRNHLESGDLNMDIHSDVGAPQENIRGGDYFKRDIDRLGDLT